MNKRIVRSSKIGGSFSSTSAHAVEAGGFVFVTGQIANRPDYQPTGDPIRIVEFGSIEEQTAQVMENLKAILEAAGTDFSHVVKRSVYLSHRADFKPVYDVMERYFTSPVASTGVAASLIAPSARLVVDVIAIIP